MFSGSFFVCIFGSSQAYITKRKTNMKLFRKSPPYSLLLPVLIAISAPCYSQDIYKAAYNEYYHGDLSKSVTLLTRAIAHKQETAKAYMYRGAANSLLGNYPAAQRDLDSSMVLDTTNTRMYFYYAKLYLLKGEYSMAVLYYNIAGTKDPGDADIYDGRGAAKAMLGDFAGGIADADMAIKIDSTQSLYYCDRGYMKIKIKQYEAAVKDLDISLRLEPNQKAWANRGLALSFLEKHQQAIDDYTKSLALSPANPDIYFYRALSYKALGKNTEACGDLTKSKQLGYPPAEEELKKLSCK
jgi:tetratricopeptide (TPR) repeat protein